MKRTIGVLAFVLLAVIAVYLTKVVGCYSSREGAINDEQTEEVAPPQVDKLLDSLSLDWNSEESPRWPAAKLMAELCETAYSPPVDAKSTFKQLGFSKWETVVDGSMIGYVLIHEDTAVVVFRGTDNRVDWLANVAATSTPTANGPIHSGFFKAYTSSDADTPLRPQVNKILTENEIKTAWISGHSLGGALALVAGCDLLDNDSIKITGIVTFGQPAVTKQELASYLDQKLVGRYARFVNHDDIVPRVPVSFKPCGRLVWFTDNGLKRSPPKVVFGASNAIEVGSSPDVEEIEMMSTEEFQQLQNRLQQNPVTLPDGTVVYSTSYSPFGDHSMEKYKAEIQELLSQ